MNNGWTVRQAEQFAVAAKRGADSASAKRTTLSETDLTREVGAKLGAKVQLKHTAHGGQLIIHFKNDKDLGRITEALTKSAE